MKIQKYRKVSRGELGTLLKSVGLKLTKKHLYNNNNWNHCDVLHFPNGERLVLNVVSYDGEQSCEAELEILKFET